MSLYACMYVYTSVCVYACMYICRQPCIYLHILEVILHHIYIDCNCIKICCH